MKEQSIYGRDEPVLMVVIIHFYILLHSHRFIQLYYPMIQANISLHSYSLDNTILVI